VNREKDRQKESGRKKGESDTSAKLSSSLPLLPEILQDTSSFPSLPLQHHHSIVNPSSGRIRRKTSDEESRRVVSRAVSTVSRNPDHLIPVDIFWIERS